MPADTLGTPDTLVRRCFGAIGRVAPTIKPTQGMIVKNTLVLFLDLIAMVMSRYAGATRPHLPMPRYAVHLCQTVFWCDWTGRPYEPNLRKA